MKHFSLPFEIERACRCSFVVRFENDEHAFISNENLLYLAQHPGAQFEIVEREDHRNNMRQKWIMVAKTVWTFGFKGRIFKCDGEPI